MSVPGATGTAWKPSPNGAAVAEKNIVKQLAALVGSVPATYSSASRRPSASQSPVPSRAASPKCRRSQASGIPSPSASGASALSTGPKAAKPDVCATVR